MKERDREREREKKREKGSLKAATEGERTSEEVRSCWKAPSAPIHEKERIDGGERGIAAINRLNLPPDFPF